MIHLKYRLPDDPSFTLKGNSSGEVGKVGKRVAEHYFNNSDAASVIQNPKKSNLPTDMRQIIIKSTESKDIDFTKLKISSQRDHDRLLSGTMIMRIVNVGQRDVDIYFLIHAHDFETKPEARWSVHQISN